MSPTQSLDSLFKALSRAWIVKTEFFSESERTDQKPLHSFESLLRAKFSNQKVFQKTAIPPKKRRKNNSRENCFSNSTSQFYVKIKTTLKTTLEIFFGANIFISKN